MSSFRLRFWRIPSKNTSGIVPQTVIELALFSTQ
jgi:hypothetical protein